MGKAKWMKGPNHDQVHALGSQRGDHQLVTKSMIDIEELKRVNYVAWGTH